MFRFLVQILGPKGSAAQCLELGRAVGTIFTDEVGHNFKILNIKNLRESRLFPPLLLQNSSLSKGRGVAGVQSPEINSNHHIKFENIF